MNYISYFLSLFMLHFIFQAHLQSCFLYILIPWKQLWPQRSCTDSHCNLYILKPIDIYINGGSTVYGSPFKQATMLTCKKASFSNVNMAKLSLCTQHIERYRLLKIHCRKLQLCILMRPIFLFSPWNHI